MILKQFNQLDFFIFFSSYTVASFLQIGSCFCGNKSKIIGRPQQAVYHHLNEDQVVLAIALLRLDYSFGLHLDLCLPSLPVKGEQDELREVLLLLSLLLKR